MSFKLLDSFLSAVYPFIGKTSALRQHCIKFSFAVMLRSWIYSLLDYEASIMAADDTGHIAIDKARAANYPEA